MKAEIVMIGTELLLGKTVDTNAVFLAEELAKLGINVYYKSTVGDNWLRMIEVLSQALSRSDLVITSGGLGPTTDDLTREAIAALVNRKLKLNRTALKEIQLYFSRSNRNMSVNNKKQAYLPDGAVGIKNNWGTAPGILLELPQNKLIISLPGVPRELKGMFHESVAPFLHAKSQESCLLSRTLKFVGIGESHLVEIINDVIINQTNPTIAPYASLGEVKVRITAKAESQIKAQALIKPMEEQLKLLLQPYFYGVDQDTLEGVIGARLKIKNETLACAESCTGGLITHRITNIPGSSDYFERGFITYSNKAKVELLGVGWDLIKLVGAVSKEVAIAMAVGAQKAANTTWGLGVTGIAGPSGATAEKPVGLVHIAVARNGHTKAEVHKFSGNREEIKFRASQAALNLLRQSMD